MRICVDDPWSSDGFATYGRIWSSGEVCMYEKINLYSYPSMKDFSGDRTVVNDGDTATIIRYAGRPTQIRPDPQFSEYDVYDILINGKVYQAMKHNLEEIDDKR